MLNPRGWLVIAVGILLGTASWGQVPDADRVVEIEGVRVHFSVQGDGNPVVLIHGFCANRQVQWDLPGITGNLARNYQVIALDNRGHGRSSKPHDPAKYGMEMVHDVARVLDHLRLPKAHIVGYSMGGLITAKFAATYPDRVLTATAGGVGWMQPDTPTELDHIAKALEEDGSLGPLITALTPEGAPKPTPLQIRQINAMLMGLGNDPKALAAVARGMKQLSIPEPEFKRCSVPLQFVVGTRDPLGVGLKEAQAARSGIKVVTIEGADHMNTFQKPEFIQSVRDFIANGR
ncbi:MAG TPA: alpha/beta hydrolase [Gemmatales bacterium]|nr:alpha/beta hydrolase [Gemmatales bacterium]